MRFVSFHRFIRFALIRLHGARLRRPRVHTATPVSLEPRVLLDATLVQDIRAGGMGSNLFNLTNVNGTLYFTADNDGVNGSELWKSNGTASGTVMVRDIRSGSLGTELLNPTNVNGTLYFRADDGTNGYELWKSDGTSSGTMMVRDIRLGGNSNPFSLTNVNGTLFFRASDGNGYQLWKSDGTSSGTMLVRDIWSGGDSIPQGLTNVNGTLYFGAQDGTDGVELWKSDGTSSGTVLVRSIRSGPSGSYPQGLTNVNGMLYFTAHDGTNGRELWKSDGTSSGTVLVRDIRSGGDSVPTNLTNVNGTLYFRANEGIDGDELWKSDGSSLGTVLVRDIQSGGSGNSYYLTNVNGTLYFKANDGTHGRELWKSDGTSSGTVMIRDIRSDGGSGPQNLTNVNGVVYFRANDGTNGYELWQSDGTSSGTVLVQSIRSGAAGSYPKNLTNVNGTLYFQAYDDTTGYELWKVSFNFAPTDITLSTTSVAENQAVGTAVGTFSTTDSDAGNTFTYSLVSGAGSTDNASFTIDGETLKTAASFDVETKSSYSIRVRTTDQGGKFFERAFPITVTNANETPTDISLSAVFIDENESSGTFIGTFTTTDPDAGDTFTYTLVGGGGSTDNASFTMDGDTLKTAARFDFETKSSYSIRVRSTDNGGEWTESQFIITVSDVDDTPSDITLSATSIAENQPAGTAVGIFTTTDQDAGNTFTYTLVSGSGSTDNGGFTIDGNTLKIATSFDFEAKSGYSIRVRSTDNGGEWFEKAFTISVTDGNDGATQVVLSNVVTSLLASANTSGAIRLADVAVTDDGLGTNTFSVSGRDATVFEVVNSQLHLKAGTALNYATKKTYSVTVNVDDSTVGGTPDASVSYTLNLQDFVVVQNGAVGRSYVRYVTLTFGASQGLAEAVASVGTATPRIRLLWGGSGGKVWSPRTLTSSMVSTSGHQLLFDFGPQGVGGVANSAVGDGLYRLRVDLDGSVDSAGRRLYEVVANFFRLFGDADGNGMVNQADVTAVTQAQGLIGLNLAADLDGDGDVDADDLNNVKKRLGARVWFVV